jgi:hypothetical protein
MLRSHTNQTDSEGGIFAGARVFKEVVVVTVVVSARAFSELAPVTVITVCTAAMFTIISQTRCAHKLRQGMLWYSMISASFSAIIAKVVIGAFAIVSAIVALLNSSKITTVWNFNVTTFANPTFLALALC